MKRPTVYIATLGNSPQVVTLGLDILLPQYPFVEVCVIHTDDRPEDNLPQMKFSTMHETIQTLDGEFLNAKLVAMTEGEKKWEVDYLHPNGDYYRFNYRRILLQREEQEPGQLPQFIPIKDVETDQNAKVAFRTIYRIVRQYKEQGACIHFCVAGGRKSMSLFAMASAQMRFSQEDKLWHVVSQYEFMNTREMHDKSDTTRIIAIPFVSLSKINPVMGMLINSSDPYDMIEAQENYLDTVVLSRKGEFLQDINADERKILMGIAQGLNNQEIASRLNKSASTIANKLTEIYELYLDHRALTAPQAVPRQTQANKRAFLASEFGEYFRQQGEFLERLPEEGF